MVIVKQLMGISHLETCDWHVCIKCQRHAWQPMPRHFWGECPSARRRQEWQQKYKESLPPDEEYLCSCGGDRFMRYKRGNGREEWQPQMVSECTLACTAAAIIISTCCTLQPEQAYVAPVLQRMYYFGLVDGLIQPCFKDPDFTAHVGRGRQDTAVGSMFRWVTHVCTCSLPACI
jgi:hypothetical protein